MMVIHLHNVLFYAAHGVHEEEKNLGGEFLINLSATFQTNRQIDSLEHTVNYVELYEIVKQRMDKPSALIETVAMDIARKILAQFSILHEVHISIEKLHPPITSFQGSTGVSYTLNRENIT